MYKSCTRSPRAIPNVIALVVMMLCLAFVANAFATDKPVEPPKTVAPTTTTTTTLTPATPFTTVVTPEQTVTSSNTTYTYDEVRTMIASYERRTKSIIAIDWIPGGLKSVKECVDPVKKGWINVGQTFRNTRANGAPFWDVWEREWKICGAKRVKNGEHFFMKGTKLNCGNEDILIPVGKAKKVKRVIKRSIEVRTWAEAVRIVVTSNTTTTTTVIPAVTVTHYSCPSGAELVTVDGSPMCQVITTTTTCPKGSIETGKDCIIDVPVVKPPPKDDKCPPKDKKGGKYQHNNHNVHSGHRA